MRDELELPEITLEFTGDDIFVIAAGIKIAKRGRPGTPQAKTWVSLEPGWEVYSSPPDHTRIEVICKGVRVH
jgi:hypothetical protein